LSFNAWSKDLYFTIEEDYWELSILDLYAISFVEDVAQSGAFLIWVERDRSALVFVAVGESEEGFTSGESVEAVVSVSLDLVMVEVLSVFTETVDGLQKVVDVRVTVHVSPKRLSVSGIHTTTVGLLITIVDDGDTNGTKSESEGSLEELVARAGREETWVVVVVDEVTSDSDVRPGVVGTIIVVLKAAHRTTVLESVSEGGVESVVEN